MKQNDACLLCAHVFVFPLIMSCATCSLNTTLSTERINCTTGMQSVFKPGLSDNEKAILTTINAFQLFAGSSLNALVILVLTANFRTLLQVPSNRILLSLVISDVLSCLLFLPYHIYLLWSGCRSHLQNEVYRTVAAFSSAYSVSNMNTLTLDRYIAVVHPLRYNALVTATGVCYVLIFAWSSAIAFAILFFNTLHFELTSLKFTLECFAVGALLFTIVMYWKMFRSARGQIKKIHTVYGSQRDGELKTSLKSAATIVRVVLLFVLCYVPLLVFAFLVENSARPREEKARFLTWALSFSFCNSCVNPLVYFIFSPRFRNAVRTSVRRWIC